MTRRFHATLCGVLVAALALTACGDAQPVVDSTSSEHPDPDEYPDSGEGDGVSDGTILDDGRDERAEEIEAARQREEQLRAQYATPGSSTWVRAETVIAPGSQEVYFGRTAAFDTPNRPRIADVRAGLHDGFDRLVIELGGGMVPGWIATFEDACPGDPFITVPEVNTEGVHLELVGYHALSVILSGMREPATDADRAFLNYDIPVLGPVLRQARVRDWNGGFIAVYLGIGLLPDDPQPQVVVRAVNNPSRLIVDVFH